MPQGLGTTYVSAVTAGGLIAMPIAVLSAHSQPVTSATATAGASTSASPSGPAATPAARRAAGRPPAVPGLSISVTDGKTAVRPGEQLTYLVSVKDIGTLGAPHLKVTQTLPAGLAFVSASGHGVAARGQVAWITGIGPGGAKTFTVVTKLVRIPVRQLRLAAVACAEPQGSAQPMVCAAHLDRLPAVAARPAAKPTGSPGGVRAAYIAAGLAVLVVGALLVIVGRRFGRRHLPG
jgi:uncharacterized repeat protein (TIGR01451 family)